MIGSSVPIFFTSLQNFIAREPLYKEKYGDFQNLLPDPSFNIAEQVK